MLFKKLEEMASSGGRKYFMRLVREIENVQSIKLILCLKNKLIQSGKCPEIVILTRKKRSF